MKPAAAVLRSLRDLAAANAAARSVEEIKRHGTAPTMTQLANRSGVPVGQLEDVLFTLKAEGLVTTVGGKPVVTSLGHQRLAEMAREAAP